MRSSFLFAGNLLVILGAATPAELQHDDECVRDELYNCFSSSLVQASQFCTNSIVTATAFSEVVTVTPTVTITNAVTETATITQSPPLRARRRKRGCSHRPPLNCLRSFASSVKPSQFTSACSCIGVTAATEVATVTANVTNTIVETPTVTEYATVSPTPSVEESTHEPTLEPTTTSLEESTHEPTLEPTATLAPESTTTSVEESTPEPTITSAPESTTTTVSITESTTSSAPPPLITNGNFKENSLEGWTVYSSTGGAQAKSIPYGGAGNYVMQLASSYFDRNSVAAIAVGQRISCEPGSSYRITTQVNLVSSYTNGNPWSVTIGSTTFVSGAGSSLAWTQYSTSFVCSSTEAKNDLVFRIQSNNNRRANLMVDFVTVVKL